jgi:hypothetical protein
MPWFCVCKAIDIYGYFACGQVIMKIIAKTKLPME